MMHVEQEGMEVIRGKIDGKEKYCRIPVRSKLGELMQEDGVNELNAEVILAMPHEQAVKTIDAIITDWTYWLKRAGELWCLYEGVRKDGAENATD